MTVSTLKIGKQEYVVVPRKDFDRLRRQAEDISAQDKGDVAEANRRANDRSIPFSRVRSRLGP
jgi:hypothetical protein